MTVLIVYNFFGHRSLTMTDVLRPGFPLRLNSELFEKKDAAPPPQVCRYIYNIYINIYNIYILISIISTYQALPQEPPPHREEEEEEYLLKWGEHNNQVINIFHQLCQVIADHTKIKSSFAKKIFQIIKNI